MDGSLTARRLPQGYIAGAILQLPQSREMSEATGKVLPAHH